MCGCGDGEFRSVKDLGPHPGLRAAIRGGTYHIKTEYNASDLGGLRDLVFYCVSIYFYVHASVITLLHCRQIQNVYCMLVATLGLTETANGCMEIKKGQRYRVSTSVDNK